MKDVPPTSLQETSPSLSYHRNARLKLSEKHPPSFLPRILSRWTVAA